MPRYRDNNPYYQLGEIVSTMTPFEAAIVKALRRDGWTWNGIAGAARDVFHWDVPDTQLAGEELCILAAQILGYDKEFDAPL